MENVLAEDGEEAGGFVHAFETYGAGWKLDQGRGWRCFGLRAAGCGGQWRRLYSGARGAGVLGLLGRGEGVVGHIWERGVLAGYIFNSKFDGLDKNHMAILWLVLN